MSFDVFSQNDPRWAAFKFPTGETLGQIGCLITCHADFAHAHHLEATPGELAQSYVDHGFEVQGDLTPDDALERVYPELQLVDVRNFDGVPADLSDLGAGDDEFVYIGINKSGAWPATHFVAILEAEADPVIADPWDGQEKPLSTYGDPATVIVKRVRYRYVAPQPVNPSPVPDPPPAPPAPEPPPAPAPTPAPDDDEAFVTKADLAAALRALADTLTGGHA